MTKLTYSARFIRNRKQGWAGWLPRVVGAVKGERIECFVGSPHADMHAAMQAGYCFGRDLIFRAGEPLTIRTLVPRPPVVRDFRMTATA